MDIKQVAEWCVAHRHEQIIAKQKEAISELRKYVKEMEELTVNMSLPNLATHQILKLKNSNNKLKEKLAAEKLAAEIDYLRLSDDEIYQEMCRLKELTESINEQLSMEQQYRLQTQEALDGSEEMYLKFIRAINLLFDIDNVAGCRPISYADDSSIREDIINERNNGIEVIIDKIKVLKSQVERREHLLQNYEDDLKKLHENETKANNQSSKITSLEMEVRACKDEIDYLRESLKKSRGTCADLNRFRHSFSRKKMFSMDHKNIESGKLSRDKITNNLKFNGI